MALIELLALATSLSLDVAVVSVGAGSLTRLRIFNALSIALVFTFFHAGLFLLGALAGDTIIGRASFGAYVSAVLLLFVAGKMLYESRRAEDVVRERDILRFRTLLVLGIAVSIDAFAVGISLALVDVSITLAAMILAAVTFLLSLLGIYAGYRSRHLIGTRTEVLGALVLILLAFKILFLG